MRISAGRFTPCVGTLAKIDENEELRTIINAQTSPSTSAVNTISQRINEMKTASADVLEIIAGTKPSNLQVEFDCDQFEQKFFTPQQIKDLTKHLREMKNTYESAQKRILDSLQCLSGEKMTFLRSVDECAQSPSNEQSLMNLNIIMLRMMVKLNAVKSYFQQYVHTRSLCLKN